MNDLNHYPYYAIGESNEYDKDKEISFNLKNYIWFAPKQTHCGIHNQHPFLEVHTQLGGVGRMIKYTSNDYTANYEEQRLSIGSTQSHAYSKITECDKSTNKMQMIYPWHEYYSETDCIWLVTEFWPVGNMNKD